MAYLKKHTSTIIIILILALLFIPQTGKPIKVFMSRLFSFSPSEIAKEDRKQFQTYDWKMVDLHGETINFKFSKGKVTVVNFWATWCPPCLAEMPSFQSLFDAYINDVDFYFIAMEDREKLNSFLNEKGYFLPVFTPDYGVPEELSSYSLPTTYVISKKGEIVIDKTGAAKWDSAAMRDILDRLIEEPLP